MCSWKAVLLLACAASLILSVASDVQVDADDQSTVDTQATGDTEETATTEPTADTQATGDTAYTSDASCGRPPRCKKDQVYTDCKNVSCTLYSCSELGFPLKCDSNCKPGCVCNNSTLLLDDNGNCIPRDQCPSCGGDENAGPGCGSYCINCSNYKKKPVACPLSCILNGCQCKDGFIYDRNIKKCVLPTQCTPTCGLNEVFSDCTNGGCDARNCSQVGKPVPCVRPKICLQGCICAKDYLRAANGTCVPKDQCNQPKCNANEVYDVCPAPCPPRRCDVDDRVIRCAAPPKPGDKACQPGCRCTDGYARNATGSCVLRSQCEKPLKCKANEVYSSCPGICPAQKCGVDPALILCQPNPEYGDPRCQPACQCVDGYVRNANNVCIPKEQCPKCNANEVYDVCPAPCPPRRCDVDDRVIKCAAPPKPGDAACQPGCRCTDGYARNATGSCVLRSQCEKPLKCKANEVYNSCPGLCPPQNCGVDSRRIFCPRNPVYGESWCRPSCRCVDGYLRNANNVCIPKKQCPPKCKANEFYDSCPGICPPQKGGIYPAVIVCPSALQYRDPKCQPDCKCVNGYVRNANKVCVPKEQYPPTCGANEVYSDCTNGGCDARNCTQVGKPVPCVKRDPSSCIKGCVCAEGYLRDASGTCVPKDQCPQQCGQNAYWETCISGCSNQTCDDIGKIFHCPIQPAVCRTGCRCNPGFWRNKDNKCVAESECPTPPCPEGETYNRCPTVKCDGDYCPKTKDSPQTCPVGIVCDPPRCTCGFNSHRDRKTGKCIATSDCPPFPCGPNEDYHDCSGGCLGDDCSVYLNDTKCPPYRIGIVVPCKPQCKCKTGYYRNSSGVCILAAQCGPKKTTTTTTTTTTPAPTDGNNATCTGVNEFFDTCIQGCSNQTCGSIGQVYGCPALPAYCRTGCRCKPGFYRSTVNSPCMPQSQCPTPSCSDGKTYNTCPTVKCDGDYCPKTRDSPQTCPVGIVCDPPRCTCGFNQKLDRKTGKCIATRDCPPFACNGANEEYQPCPVSCPGENCTDYINDSKCPPGRIGIVLQCRPQCKCKTGYYRNSAGVCIIGSQCGPKKSPTTVTPVVITTPPPTGDGGNSGKSGASGTGVADLQAGITKFTGQFLYDRMKANPGDNIIISAFSVFTPLAELALYAIDAALNQLLAILNVKSKDDIRAAFPALTASYEGQQNVSFSTAAKIYSNINYLLSDAFKKDAVNIFHAEGQELDFSKNTEAAATINAWVESKTNNRIKDLVTPDMLSALTRIVLVNAIYFKGTWLYEFDKKNTNDADFYLSDGSTKKTKLMYQKANFNYGEVSDLDCKVIELLYQGKNFSMFVALPNSNNGVVDLADKLRDPANFAKAYGSMRSQKVEVYLPPFEITTTTDLADMLKLQNVTQIFDSSNSGLSGMLAKPEDVYVSKAVQKAFIKTDEAGSEAAAANAVVITTRALPLPPPEPKIFRADKAFLYYITFKSTVLFSGVFNG